MAETSYFWDNPGTGDSPLAGYGHAELMEVVFRMLLNGTANLGVLRGWLGELEATDGGGLNAAVATGGAIVYGFFYHSNVAETVAVPNNATNHVVVRCNWAAQTARLAVVAALVQTAGATWDIPLARVTTVGGAITLIVDEREFCEFSADMIHGMVTSAYIAVDAVTTDVLEDQVRAVFCGTGMMHPDDADPATWYNLSAAVWLAAAHRSGWSFSATVLNAVWMTFRVPADFIGATIELFIWTINRSNIAPGLGDALWEWSAWVAAPNGVLANQTGSQAVNYDGRGWTQGAYRDSLGTINVAAGDLVHLRIDRDGADGADTLAHATMLFGAEFEYTADS